jgi:uncharacterized cupin superfamily protein
MKFALFAIGLLALGCGSVDPGNEELVGTAPSALEQAGIILYESGVPVPESELSPLEPADFGGTVEGDVKWSGRIDIFENGIIGGVFQATRGKHAVLYPGAVHATVHVGQVILTDELGSHRLNVGDSWLVTKGTYVRFEVKGPLFQASFMGYFNSTDAPGPVLLYPKGKSVPDSELSAFGSVAALGGTVLEGDPQFFARLDYAQGPTFAGFFQCTRGAYAFAASPFHEHNTFSRHPISVTDGDGVVYQVRPGDSLFIRAGAGFSVETSGPGFEQSALAIVP